MTDDYSIKFEFPVTITVNLRCNKIGADGKYMLGIRASGGSEGKGREFGLSKRMFDTPEEALIHGRDTIKDYMTFLYGVE